MRLACAVPLQLVSAGSSSAADWGQPVRGAQSTRARNCYARTVVASGNVDGSAEGPAAPGPVTLLLRDVAAGDAGAMQRLMDTVYQELRTLAQARMQGERSGHTLQPTALVNEVYLRLLQLDHVSWQGRAHFFRAAAEAMRRILIDHARGKNAVKRGDGRAALEITHVGEALAQADGTGLLALDEAFDRLAQVHATTAEVVRLKFYAGLGDAAVAQALGVSERSVRREWAFARGWLRERLERDSGGPHL